MIREERQSIGIDPKNRIPHTRIGWDELFIAMCFLVAQRSPDAQTQCGAVLVDKDHKVVSIGFNGWPRGFNDEEIPNTRPEKYKFVIHSEANCILNANKSDLSDCTMYVTGPCCPECLKVIIQKGIKKIIIGSNIHSTADKEKILCDYLIESSGIEVIRYNKS